MFVPACPVVVWYRIVMSSRPDQREDLELVNLLEYEDEPFRCSSNGSDEVVHVDTLNGNIGGSEPRDGNTLDSGDSNLGEEDSSIDRRRFSCGGDERIWCAVLSVMVASIPALLFGCTLGFPSPVLLSLMELDRQEFRFDTFLSDLFSVSNYPKCTPLLRNN